MVLRFDVLDLRASCFFGSGRKFLASKGFASMNGSWRSFAKIEGGGGGGGSSGGLWWGCGRGRGAGRAPSSLATESLQAEAKPLFGKAGSESFLLLFPIAGQNRKTIGVFFVWAVGNQ